MKTAKYSPGQMKLIDYQVMNAGSKKFTSTRRTWVHWSKHQDNGWFMEEKAHTFDPLISNTNRCCDEGKTETISHIYHSANPELRFTGRKRSSL